MTEPTYREAIDEGREILRRIETRHPKDWGAEGAFIELSKQVGDLAKHIMVTEGFYLQRENKERYASSHGHIEDELVDILTAVIRLAECYEIDLVDATRRVRAAEREFLERQGV